MGDCYIRRQCEIQLLHGEKVSRARFVQPEVRIDKARTVLIRDLGLLGGGGDAALTVKVEETLWNIERWGDSF